MNLDIPKEYQRFERGRGGAGQFNRSDVIGYHKTIILLRNINVLRGGLLAAVHSLHPADAQTTTDLDVVT